MKATVQIFLSYARPDVKKVENLYQALLGGGFKPWMDIKDLLPGESWEHRIQKAIRCSDFFFACLSANSVSRRGYLQKEIKYALDIWQEKLEDDIFLIPVRLEDCEVPESLRKFQWVDLFKEESQTKLMKAIQVGMERRAEAIKPVVEEPTPHELYPAQERSFNGTEIVASEEDTEGIRKSNQKTIMIPNPFQYGRPITDLAHFAGRQQQTRGILSRLDNLDSSSILGERRIGKTSLLKYISHPGTLRKFGYDPDKYLFIFVDLQDYGQHKTQSSFWRDALEEISKIQPVDSVPVIRKSGENGLVELRNRIIEHFSQDEVHTLCSDLNVDYDLLEGMGKASKARELVAYLERRGRIHELLKRLDEVRPHVPWNDTLQIVQADLPVLETRELGALFDSIGRQGKVVVLLLDEFENVTNNIYFDLEFFGSLRSLATNNNLVLITSSRRGLGELCHSKEVAGSPFFNIFAKFDLGLFAPDEADELMDKALAGAPITFDQVEREYLQQISGNHPFFLQMGGNLLFDTHVQNLKENERRGFMFQELQRQASQHLLYYWNRSTEDEQSVLMALVFLNRTQGKSKSNIQALKDMVSQSDKVLRELARRGLLHQVEDQYAPFSPLFDEWINSEVLNPLSQKGQTVEK